MISSINGDFCIGGYRQYQPTCLGPHLSGSKRRGRELEAHAHSSMQLIPSQNHDFPIRKL